MLYYEDGANTYFIDNATEMVINLELASKKLTLINGLQRAFRKGGNFNFMKPNTSFREYAAIAIFLLIVSCMILLSLYSMPITVNAQAESRTESPLSSQTTFPGSGFGLIPDGGSGCAPSPGAARDITFSVTGIPSAPSSVSVSMTFGSPVHTWMGDIVATLISPNGANKTIFGRTGATAAGSAGDSSDLGATYVFSDNAPAPPSGGWWQESTVRDATTIMTAGTYRTTDSGGAGATNPMPFTNLTSAFSGLATSNGTWTLRFTDGCSGDTGSVTAASLTLSAGNTLQQHVADYDGDGKTDFTVVRNTGGGSGGQITWFVGPATGGFTAQPWGISTDFFLAGGDYDGDHKTDITVWRQGTQGYFYILQSSNSTIRAVPFGQTGDDPTVEGDYSGDGKTDPAVYRDGASTGAQSFWYYLASSGPLNGQIVVTQWGQNGDFPAPGDYNGDHKNDFCVQRNSGINGAAVIYEHDGTGGPDVAGPTTATFWGYPTDVIVPGDYDGDGKTDIAVVRSNAGAINWYIRNSSNGSFTAIPWGLNGPDSPTQGDYDGDGRTDVAVWRTSADPSANAFYYNGTLTGVGARQWGLQGDYPVANYNTH